MTLATPEETRSHAHFKTQERDTERAPDANHARAVFHADAVASRESAKSRGGIFPGSAKEHWRSIRMAMPTLTLRQSSTSSSSTPPARGSRPGFKQTDVHPVVCISWKDATAFCQWLSKQEKANYRLPTVAEWEYAARAGATTSYIGGDSADTIYTFGKVADATLEAAHPGMTKRQHIARLVKSEGDGYVYTAPAGTLKPNRWGLFDTHGSVWEWCSDKYFDQCYSKMTKMTNRRVMQLPTDVPAVVDHRPDW